MSWGGQLHSWLWHAAGQGPRSCCCCCSSYYFGTACVRVGLPTVHLRVIVVAPAARSGETCCWHVGVGGACDMAAPIWIVLLCACFHLCCYLCCYCLHGFRASSEAGCCHLCCCQHVARVQQQAPWLQLAHCIGVVLKLRHAAGHGCFHVMLVACDLHWQLWLRVLVLSTGPAAAAPTHA